jgi:hypothetical protein
MSNHVIWIWIWILLRNPSRDDNIVYSGCFSAQQCPRSIQYYLYSGVVSCSCVYRALIKCQMFSHILNSNSDRISYYMYIQCLCYFFSVSHLIVASMLLYLRMEDGDHHLITFQWLNWNIFLIWGLLFLQCLKCYTYRFLLSRDVSGMYN